MSPKVITLPKNAKIKTFNLCEMPKMVFSSGTRAASYEPRTDCIYIGTNSSTKCLKFHVYKALIHSTLIKSRCPRDTEYVSTEARLTEGFKNYPSIIEELYGIVGAIVLLKFHGRLDQKTAYLASGFFDKFVTKGIDLNPRNSPKVRISWAVVIAACKCYISKDNHKELEKCVDSVRAMLRKNYKGRFK